MLIALMRVVIRVTRASGGRESCLSCLGQVVRLGPGAEAAAETPRIIGLLQSFRSRLLPEILRAILRAALGLPRLLPCPLLEPWFTTTCNTDTLYP